jgi:hypothetical protein
VDHAHANDAPHIRDVAVTGEHHVDPQLAQEGHHIAGVAETVAVAPGAGHGEDVVVDDEDPRASIPASELGVDPAIVLAPNLPLVEVGLRRVEGDQLGLALWHRDRLGALAGAEEVLEVAVANVPGVVIAHDDDNVGALEPVEVAAHLLELVSIALGGQIAGDGDQVGGQRVGLLDGGDQQIGFEEPRADVDV